jgi:hypothetical protein
MDRRTLSPGLISRITAMIAREDPDVTSVLLVRDYGPRTEPVTTTMAMVRRVVAGVAGIRTLADRGAATPRAAATPTV